MGAIRRCSSGALGERGECDPSQRAVQVLAALSFFGMLIACGLDRRARPWSRSSPSLVACID